jgi:Zn-dependent protease/predicted transcriptional regulator
MFSKRIKLFRLLGFEVRVDLSWLVLALLVTWSLADGLFPSYYAGLSRSTYWWMGSIGAVLFFFSILFHEFCHSLVARRFGLPMRGITLFIFGGVAEMDDEPPSPKAEFFMAIAGPISSVFLGALFYGAAWLAAASETAIAAEAVLTYLAAINGVLAIFNMLPAFPLDGGRILRAGLWHWKKNLRAATRTASRIGSGFGIFLMFIGVINFLYGRFIGGLWQFMIGMFLRSAADMSYQQVLIRTKLEGETVKRFMNPRPVTTPPSITIRELVEEYFNLYHYKMFPVMDGEKLLGFITTRQVKTIPREEWGQRIVGGEIERVSAENTVSPATSVVEVLSIMGRTGNSRLLVLEGDRLAGIITMKDIMGYVAAQMEPGERE